MKKVILVFVVILLGIGIGLKDTEIFNVHKIVLPDLTEQGNYKKKIEDILTIDDIALMRKVGVLISFNKDEKLKKISSDITPKKLLEVYAIDFNKAKMYVIPNWLSRMKNLHILNLNDTGINLEELKKITPLKKLQVLKISNNDFNTDCSYKCEYDKEFFKILKNFKLLELDMFISTNKKNHYTPIVNINLLPNSLEKLYIPYDEEYNYDDFSNFDKSVSYHYPNHSLPNLKTFNLNEKDIDKMRKDGVRISFQSDKSFKKIPLNITLEKFMEIEGIDFRDKKLKNFAWLNFIKNLKILKLKNTEIKTWNIDRLSGLTKLEKLYFKNNYDYRVLKILDSQFSNLKILDLEKKDIEIMRRKGVKISFISDRKLKKIPLNITPEKFMQIDGINFNQMDLSEKFPNWLVKMKNLTMLNLHNTQINFDGLKKISLLKKVTILNLSENPLFKDNNNYSHYYKNIMGELGNLKLIELDLSSIKYQGYRDSYSDTVGNIGKLTSLRKLNFSNNSGWNIKMEELGLKNLKKLKVLNFSNCHTYNYDTRFLPKKALIELDISNNGISYFPFNGDFPLLEVLNISKNARNLRIDKKYGSFLHLKNLKQLKVDDDAIIPDSLKKKISKLKSK